MFSLLYAIDFSSDANGNRTRVTTVKGWCLNRLTMAPKIMKNAPTRT